MPNSSAAVIVTRRALRSYRTWGLFLGFLVLAVVPFVTTAIGQPAMTGFTTKILILGIAATSLNLALGWGGMVSFGHAAYYGFGGYAVGILYSLASTNEMLFGFIPGTGQLLITLPIAIAVSTIMAFLFGAIALRTSGVQFIMITLALAQMAFFFFASLKAYGGDDGVMIRRRNTLPLLNTRDDATFYYVCLVVACAWHFVTAQIFKSKFGTVLRGIRQSESRIKAIGLEPFRYKLIAFAISGAGCGLAGALMANLNRFVSPDMLHWVMSGDLIIMIIVGGVGTIIGPAIGAAVVASLEMVASAYTEHWQIILGPILVLIALAGRNGFKAIRRQRGGGQP